MKITFTEDHQSVASGNSFYKAGAQADLRRGEPLVQMGVAYAGWGKPTNDDAEKSIFDKKPRDYDLSKLTVAELQQMADGLGISHTGLRKAELIAALDDAKEQPDYASMKKSELVEVAESYGIITAGMNKTQLIEALTEAK